MTPNQIQAVRTAYNLSPAQLAQILGVSRPTVYAWESGRNAPGAHERVILWKLLEAAQDPDAFHRAFTGVRQALAAQAPYPEDDWTPNAAVAGGMLGFGLGMLLAALFSDEGDS